MRQPFLTALVTFACLTATVPCFGADSARDMYNRALAQERTVRDEAEKPTLAQMRRAVAAYEAVVRRFPTSGYSDNALWQAANLAALTFERFGNEADRRTSTRLFTTLAQGYPSSKLAAQTGEPLARLAEMIASTDLPALATPQPVVTAGSLPQAQKTRSEPARVQVATLREIKRSVLPDGIRLTVDLDAEVPYYQEEIGNPRRVFFDLKGVKPAAGLQDLPLKFNDDVVKEVRLGRHPQNTTRLVVDLEGVSNYTVYPLYGPYRLVMDFRRAVSAYTDGRNHGRCAACGRAAPNTRAEGHGSARDAG